MKVSLLALAVVLAAPACAENAVPPSTPSPPLPTEPALPPPSPPAPPAALPQEAPRPATVTLSPEQLESLRKKQREAAEQRDRERRPWVPSSVARWRSAIESYDPLVRPGNQTALWSAAVPFAHYLNGMHDRMHHLFADFLDSLDAQPATHPLNDKHLVTRVEIVLTPDGHIDRLGVVKTSGVAEFDAAVLDAFDRAQPFGPAPGALLSPDGKVYVHWELHRDEVLACSTMNARPFLLSRAPSL